MKIQFRIFVINPGFIGVPNITSPTFSTGIITTPNTVTHMTIMPIFSHRFLKVMARYPLAGMLQFAPS
jgi:hypothetical protein